MRTLMKRLTRASGVALALAGVMVVAGGVATPVRMAAAEREQATQQADLQSVQMLTANYLAQANALGMMNAAFKFGSAFQESIPNPRHMPPLNLMGQGDQFYPTKWAEMPSLNSASAAKSIGSMLDTVTAADVLDFATKRCGGPALGSKLDALNTRFQLGMPTDIAPRFESVRTQVCQIIQVAANFKIRYEKFQSIQENGIQLAQRQMLREFKFDGMTRTVQGGFTLVWFPNVANMVLGEDQQLDVNIQFNNWMKFSDNGKKDLNLLERLSDMKDRPRCKGLPIPVEAPTMVLKVSVLEATATKATIDACMDFHFFGTTNTMNLGSVTVPAPFGYLGELESMKDGAKQEMANKIVAQIAGMFSSEQLGKINKLYSLIESLPTR